MGNVRRPLEELEIKAIEIVRRHPGCSARFIARKLGISAISENIKVPIKRGHIIRELEGDFYKHYPGTKI